MSSEKKLTPKQLNDLEPILTLGQLVDVLQKLPPRLQIRMPIFAFQTVGEARRHLGWLERNIQLRFSDRPGDELGVKLTWFNVGHDHEHLAVQELDL